MADASLPRLLEQREELFAAAYNTIDDVRETLTRELGPTTFESIEYPYAEVLPDTTVYQGGNEYRHVFDTNFYFVRRDFETYLDLLEVVHEAIPMLSTAFMGVSSTYNIRPNEIQDFAGEQDGSLIIMIRVSWRVDTVLDSAE